MEKHRTHTSASIFERCRDTRQQCIDLISHMEDDQPQKTALSDSLARLMLWAGNLGAMRQPSSKLSLDQRLAKAPEVHGLICQHLDDIQEAVDDLSNVLAQQDTPDAEDQEPVDRDSDDEGPFDEAGMILEVIAEAISALFRLGMLVRKASPTDRFKRALQMSDTSFNDTFDIGYVREKHPKMRHPEKDWLTTRLGRLISQRRLFIKYSRDHKVRLEYQEPPPGHLTEHHATQTERQSSKATTFHLDRLPVSILAPPPVDPELEGEEDADEVMSVMTASTMSNTLSVLKLPTLADLSADGEAFECPICFTLQHFQREKAWRVHAFRDLKAYVCTAGGSDQCNGEYFGDRNTWFEHELHYHRAQYICTLCPNQQPVSHSAFSEHMAEDHSQVTGHQLKTVEEVSRRIPIHFNASDCPFCDDWAEQIRQRADPNGKRPIIPADSFSVKPTLVSTTRFKRHVALHQEQLAIFALPRMVEDGDQADQDGTDNSVASSKSASLHDSQFSDDSKPDPIHMNSYKLAKHISGMIDDKISEITSPNRICSERHRSFLSAISGTFQGLREATLEFIRYVDRTTQEHLSVEDQYVSDYGKTFRLAWDTGERVEFEELQRIKGDVGSLRSLGLLNKASHRDLWEITMQDTESLLNLAKFRFKIQSLCDQEKASFKPTYRAINNNQSLLELQGARDILLGISQQHNTASPHNPVGDHQAEISAQDVQDTSTNEKSQGEPDNPPRIKLTEGDVALLRLFSNIEPPKVKTHFSPHSLSMESRISDITTDFPDDRNSDPEVDEFEVDSQGPDNSVGKDSGGTLPPPPIPDRLPCWVRALYPSMLKAEGHLDFIKDDLIECLNAYNGSWWLGRLLRDKSAVGLFPSNLVKVLPETFRPTGKSTSPVDSDLEIEVEQRSRSRDFNLVDAASSSSKVALNKQLDINHPGPSNQDEHALTEKENSRIKIYSRMTDRPISLESTSSWQEADAMIRAAHGDDHSVLHSRIRHGKYILLLWESVKEPHGETALKQVFVNQENWGKYARPRSILFLTPLVDEKESSIAENTRRLTPGDDDITPSEVQHRRSFRSESTMSADTDTDKGSGHKQTGGNDKGDDERGPVVLEPHKQEIADNKAKKKVPFLDYTGGFTDVFYGDPDDPYVRERRGEIQGKVLSEAEKDTGNFGSQGAAAEASRGDLAQTLPLRDASPKVQESMSSQEFTSALSTTLHDYLNEMLDSDRPVFANVQASLAPYGLPPGTTWRQFHEWVAEKKASNSSAAESAQAWQGISQEVGATFAKHVDEYFRGISIPDGLDISKLTKDVVDEVFSRVSHEIFEKLNRAGSSWSSLSGGEQGDVEKERKEDGHQGLLQRRLKELTADHQKAAERLAESHSTFESTVRGLRSSRHAENAGDTIKRIEDTARHVSDLYKEHQAIYNRFHELVRTQGSTLTDEDLDHASRQLDDKFNQFQKLIPEMQRLVAEWAEIEEKERPPGVAPEQPDTRLPEPFSHGTESPSPREDIVGGTMAPGPLGGSSQTQLDQPHSSNEPNEEHEVRKNQIPHSDVSESSPQPSSTETNSQTHATTPSLEQARKIEVEIYSSRGDLMSLKGVSDPRLQYAAVISEAALRTLGLKPEQLPEDRLALTLNGVCRASQFAKLSILLRDQGAQFWRKVLVANDSYFPQGCQIYMSEMFLKTGTSSDGFAFAGNIQATPGIPELVAAQPGNIGEPHSTVDNDPSPGIQPEGLPPIQPKSPGLSGRNPVTLPDIPIAHSLTRGGLPVTEKKDTPCRNIRIYGHCRYEGSGCPFNHDMGKKSSQDELKVSPVTNPGLPGQSLSESAKEMPKSQSGSPLTTQNDPSRLPPERLDDGLGTVIALLVNGNPYAVTMLLGPGDEWRRITAIAGNCTEPLISRELATSLQCRILQLDSGLPIEMSSIIPEGQYLAMEYTEMSWCFEAPTITKSSNRIGPANDYDAQPATFFICDKLPIGQPEAHVCIPKKWVSHLRSTLSTSVTGKSTIMEDMDNKW